jgi:hypothetical protein
MVPRFIVDVSSGFTDPGESSPVEWQPFVIGAAGSVKTVY